LHGAARDDTRRKIRAAGARGGKAGMPFAVAVTGMHGAQRRTEHGIAGRGAFAVERFVGKMPALAAAGAWRRRRVQCPGDAR